MPAEADPKTKAMLTRIAMGRRATHVSLTDEPAGKPEGHCQAKIAAASTILFRIAARLDAGHAVVSDQFSDKSGGTVTSTNSHKDDR